jgi:predicted Rossmann-fold nucleotide-binding protein
MGSNYWSGLLKWIANELEPRQLIGPNDLQLITMTDDIDVAMSLMQTFLQSQADQLGYAAVIPE